MIREYLTPEQLQERANEYELTIYTNEQINEKVSELEKAYNDTKDTNLCPSYT